LDQRHFKFKAELLMSMLIMVGEESALQDLTITELLEARIHGRTGGRLRFLRVHEIGNQVCVSAAAPSYHVRQLAEQAALSLIARDYLQLEIDVLSSINWGEPEFERSTPRERSLVSKSTVRVR
jgi:hypothetical protein